MEHQFRENGSHYNGGAEWFGYGYSALGEPRLSMVRKWQRKGARKGQYDDSYSVDGRPVANYAAALEALKVPVAFTPDELAALRLIGAEPAKHREVDVEVRWSLRAKGAIAYGPPGECAMTDLGRAAIVKPGSGEPSAEGEG